MSSIVRENLERASLVLAQMEGTRMFLKLVMKQKNGPEELQKVVDEASGNKLDRLLPYFEKVNEDGD